VYIYMFYLQLIINYIIKHDIMHYFIRLRIKRLVMSTPLLKIIKKKKKYIYNIYIYVVS